MGHATASLIPTTRVDGSAAEEMNRLLRTAAAIRSERPIFNVLGNGEDGR